MDPKVKFYWKHSRNIWYNDAINFLKESKVSGAISYVNQPYIKQGIKYAIGVPTVGCGALALCYVVTGKTSKFANTSDTWEGTADRITHAMAYVSFVLSATVSPIGVWGISKAVGWCFSSAQVEKVFGPNTVFESNWKHPRHVASLAAVGLALPILVKRIFVSPFTQGERDLQRIALFTVVTSRPTLHIGNQLFQKLFS